MSGFANERVIEMLNDSFVPVAIDINLVMHQKDSEGEFFRHIAEQGHYAGRTKPTSTRQGLYVASVDGDLLHSLNSPRPDRIIALMNRGLAKWESKEGSKSKLKPFLGSNDPDNRYRGKFPEGGLILRETMRDLPRGDVYKQTTDRHNLDYVWLTAEEKNQFKPSSTAKVGQTWAIANETVARIVQFHTVDQVRGEADNWTAEEVVDASLQAAVTKIDKNKATIKLSGKARCRKRPSGRTNPFNKRKIKVESTNDLSIKGWLVLDLDSGQFDSFRMLAAGMRSGAAIYNFRWDDQGPAPIGFAFELLENKPENRIQPKFLVRNYFSGKK